jgi:hypothetical protein
MNLERPVYIVLRQSPDWPTQTYADLEKTREFCRMIGRREDLIIDVVKLWDRTFGISFFATRQIMKEISLENFRAVTGASFVRLDEVRALLRPDAFYLFTDDDDWYYPGIAQVLQRIDPRKCAAVHWDSAVFSKGLTVMRDGMFWSNNYAVSGRYLLQRKQNLEIVSQHFRADGAFRARVRAMHRRMGYRTLLQHLFTPGYRVSVHVEGCLSVENKHPASTVVLEQIGDKPSGEHLHALIREIMDANRSARVPAECRWMQPLIDRVHGLCARLLNSKQKKAGAAP